MNAIVRPPLVTTLEPSNHPYLNGAWTPLHEEVDADDLEVVEGAIPRDIDGVYLRNTENQIHQPLGRYHPFDGDGMIHQIDFKDGRASYRNRWVRTRGLVAEQVAGGSIWGGLMDGPGTSKRPGFGAHGGLKDTASTDVIVHGGLALCTFYQCGEAYALDPETLEQARRRAVGAARRRFRPSQGRRSHGRINVLQLFDLRALHALWRGRQGREDHDLHSRAAAGAAPAARHGDQRALFDPQ